MLQYKKIDLQSAAQFLKNEANFVDCGDNVFERYDGDNMYRYTLNSQRYTFEVFKIQNQVADGHSESGILSQLISHTIQNNLVGE